ncbi:MAG: HlyD family efflux transporter periplasmic adaptor subunit [Myxococcales bacterium]|nr:HlyD family efflux transporter periplasmic adaptor subunit [Myxococcales bacterium]
MSAHPYRGADQLPIGRFLRTPRFARNPARLVALLLVAVFLALVVTPWQQTAAGEGRVIAFSPLDREQRIEAPIDGRVTKWHVQEGSIVREGDTLAELADNDPEIMSRLRLERDAVKKRIVAAEARVAAAEARVTALGLSQKAAQKAAKLRVTMATSRIAVAKKALEATVAAEKTAKANLERQKGLLEKGLASVRALELAELDYARASTDVDRAKVAQMLAEADELTFEADRLKVEADTTVSLEDGKATAAIAAIEVASSNAELSRVEVRLARQDAQIVKAPRAGVVLKLVAKQGTEMVKAGDALAILVPNAAQRALELWVDGRDSPLIRVGAHVRVQFEGWPALQFSGWPSITVGTFGGTVSFVDATDDGKGKFRVVVVPDGVDPWPSPDVLRQGTRVHGWFQLGRVKLGYELWRQFNGFPPTVPAPVPKETKP